ncbi:dolichyl-P-Man [Leishmania donovani]|uniref:Mannosyltransferase n=3 Tax=Leishmania donovani species complex TaxID=38574 RepID=A0A6L0WUS4_LEIIN|nr:putative Alg9-like mannosyltransferase [Leishmania infantum JPCM5]TPP44266.1 Alg9-like mannosyltransferase family protein [Leishmania donovani]CAC9462489.1 dolichyl-P-Man:GDP-Man5GlcNAc2-PP-dolichyl_alpha-1_-2-mannosyltransferase_-_putative [Leishmania infantum]CAJ1986983.1 dolichyl-P-Man [Leishmania donovani]CBZ08405.1 putative Alg9-like mannosyltransferase [Leishmania infantum JPCM5]SUZ39939.1 dolichyl-P-Man:GDP-Man5GlcNAc2-PP-dolichyl_alpha-1_-2-mannosyltransferase_-_putative [Leishmania|eukprot:XP_003392257.1 putative Alg9-like mannosyltransferase [Leishmania infantum JPCM5]
MHQRITHYLQMAAALLLLSLTHYFASCFLPISDCDETFNFVEPIHYLLYGSGKQTWEMCSRFALRSWLFLWIYAWRAVLIRGAASLSSVRVYFYLRIMNGCAAALAELFFVCSVWLAFSGKAAGVALLLLLSNYPIHHAAVSVLPTSFAMICNFVVLGCWLRTQPWTTYSPASPSRFKGGSTRNARSAAAAHVVRLSTPMPSSSSSAPPRHLCWFIGAALFFSALGIVTGWPFAVLISALVGLDLLLHFPAQALACTLGSLLVVCAATFLADARYYCRWTLSSWNVVTYNLFGNSGRGAELFGVEPCFFFWKNLLLNFHLMFVAVMLAPLVLLYAPRRELAATSARSDAVSSGRPPGDGAAQESNDSAVSPTNSLVRSRLRTSGTHGSAAELHSSLLANRHPGEQVLAAKIGAAVSRVSRQRELLYVMPFFVWFLFWMSIAHKEERFMSPAYPFMVLAATRTLCLMFFPDAAEGQPNSAAATPKREKITPDVVAVTAADAQDTALTCQPPRRPSLPPQGCPSPAFLGWRHLAGLAFFLAFFLLSYSRAMAVYVFYSGPERMFFDWYPVLQAEAQRAWEAKRQAVRRDAAVRGQASPSSLPPGTTAQQTQELRAYYTVCLGREWYRFPSSFFVDHRWIRYQFLETHHFHGMLPLSFVTPPAGQESGFLRAPSSEAAAATSKSPSTSSSTTARGSCSCGAPGVNDLNQEIPEQYVRYPSEQCDAIFDSLSPPSHVSAAHHATELKHLQLDTVFTRSLLNISALQAVLKAGRKTQRVGNDAYAVLDVDRTPLWCRVLYYPFGVTRRCAVWRPLVLNSKP